MLTKFDKTSPLVGPRNIGTRGLELFLWFFLSTPIFAQQEQSRTSMREQASLRQQGGLPELAIQNLDRVAASAEQIGEVLRKDPGLMVELKRWVAKDATDNGQVIEDSDITDQAIFDRLGSDVLFRSVATRLLQRYGFLIPTVNPQSESSKERDLILKKRARRLAQIEKHEHAASLQKQKNVEAQTPPTQPSTPPRYSHCA